MKADERQLWLVLAVGHSPGMGAEILLRENFDSLGVQKVSDARKRKLGSFAAAMDAEGRFAVLSDGRIYDPIKDLVDQGSDLYAQRGEQAYETAQSLFRRMEHRPWQAFRHAIADRLKTPRTRRTLRAVGGGFGFVAVVLAVLAVK